MNTFLVLFSRSYVSCQIAAPIYISYTMSPTYIYLKSYNINEIQRQLVFLMVESTQIFCCYFTRLF